MSLLAEVYDGGETRLAVAEIAERRGLQAPFLSKVLTTLAQAGLVDGSRGPGGGFTLSREPGRIRLEDVCRPFETEPRGVACPFGAGTCGVGENCPLHDRFAEVQTLTEKILRETTLDVFR